MRMSASGLRSTGELASHRSRTSTHYSQFSRLGIQCAFLLKCNCSGYKEGTLLLVIFLYEGISLCVHVSRCGWPFVSCVYKQELIPTSKFVCISAIISVSPLLLLTNCMLTSAILSIPGERERPHWYIVVNDLQAPVYLMYTFIIIKRSVKKRVQRTYMYWYTHYYTERHRKLYIHGSP